MLMQLQETRKKILELLKINGPMSADELARQLKISSMGIRQHLKALESDQLVQYLVKKRGVGRPGYFYLLTPAGDELFPRSYSQMANSILEAIDSLDGAEGLERIFKKRTEQLEAQYKTRMSEKTFAERVAELAKIRTEEGYMADWEQLNESTFLLREHNCSICQVASQCPQACTFELKLFQRVFSDAKVTRQDHMMQGDQKCTYLIRRKVS